MADARDLARRWLEQRRQLGESELVLQTVRPPRFGATAAAPSSGGPGTEIPPPVAVPRPERDRSPATGAETLTPRERSAGATAPGATSLEIIQIGDLATLRETALGCPRCRLSETRTRVVFGEGSPNAELMVVGEAPGADEDRTGRPFVGRAGQLLDRLLAAVGFERESVFICNVLKCRPPQNRNPNPDEIEACSPYLVRQLELVQPRAIFAVGGFAAQTLLATTVPIGRLRGTIHSYRDVPLVPTYHPAALLRNPAWIRPVWEDLQRLRSIVDPR